MLDVRIPDAGIERVDTLRASLPTLGDFSQVHNMKRGAFVVEFSADRPPETRSMEGEPVGVRATSRDEHWVVQLRRDGLTFSRLPPYPNWHEFSSRAKPFLSAFLAVTRPPYVERLALRYINHFRLPYPADMNEYFIGLPVVPDTLPQFTSNMLSRVTIHDPDRDFTAHITQGLLDDLDPEKIAFILDIDVFQTAEFAPVEEKLWETLEDLRGFKNQVFFELITERNAEAHE